MDNYRYPPNRFVNRYETVSYPLQGQGSSVTVANTATVVCGVDASAFASEIRRASEACGARHLRLSSSYPEPQRDNLIHLLRISGNQAAAPGRNVTVTKGHRKERTLDLVVDHPVWLLLLSQVSEQERGRFEKATSDGSLPGPPKTIHLVFQHVSPVLRLCQVGSNCFALQLITIL